MNEDASSKNLPAIKAGTDIALSQAKSLLRLTNSVLGKNHALLLVFPVYSLREPEKQTRLTAGDLE